MPDDTLKVIDSTVFRTIKDDDDEPYYSSPEFRKSRTVGKPGNVWAIGVLLYNLLSGEQPFQGEDTPEVIKNIKDKKVRFDHDEFDSVSKDAKDLVELMLEKNPAKRITAEKALDHPWFKKDDKDVNVLFHIKVMKRLKRFRQRSMLKQLTLM